MRKNSINGSTVHTYNPEYNRNSYKKKAKEKGSSMKKKIVSLHSYSLDENTGFDVVKNIRVLY